MKNFLIVALILVTLGLCLLLISIILRTSTGGEIPYDYGIVLDAGSSHTSVYLYKWLADQVNNTGIVSGVKSCETHSGIDDNEDNTDATLNDLLPCVKNLSNFIEYRKNDATPIYLGATAGMRLLNITNPRIAKIIFLEIENSFLRFREQGKLIDVKDIRILTGKEEALFGWVTTNYLLKVFPKIGSKVSTPNRDSYGMLDMGGASAQIAYEVFDEKLFDTENITKVRLYGHNYYVRGESNLCFGADEVFARYRFLQLLDKPGSKEFDDPCYVKGSKLTIKANKIFTICTETVADVKSVEHKKDDEYIFNGVYDEAKCTQAIDRLLDLNYCDKTFKRCFIQEQTSPPEDMKFYALSSYFYVTAAIRGKNDTRKHFDYEQYLQGMNAFCSQDYSAIAERYQKQVKFAVNYCFQLRYILQSLKSIYKIDQKQLSNVNFVKKISDESLGWALGFMINATNLIPPELPEEPIISSGVLVLLIIISLIVIFIGFAFLFKWKSSKKENLSPGKQTRTLELEKI